jgi:plasmid maintenance system antidote protein VapI
VLEVSPQAVSNWLSGRQELTGEQALALQEFLGEARRSEAFFWGIFDDQ